MSSFRIQGGVPLRGEITPQGAKNEALQIICATLLTEEPVVIHNVPDILDVNNLIQLLIELGCQVEKLQPHSFRIKAAQIQNNRIQSPEFHKMTLALRGSVMLLGPMLARFGTASIPMPGGDKIGRRRLDSHFQGFMSLGAKINYDQKNNLYSVDCQNLIGADILLEEASITGTANIIMASVLSKGTTTIYHAACEPYLQQLCSMLNRMGAKISGIGSNLITIEGVDYLKGTEHTILPDMIEVGSFIGLAAITESEITIKNCSIKSLGIIPKTFQKLGIEMEFRNDDIFIPAQQHYEIENFMDGSILTIADAPWPGFTPDLISVAIVVATQAKGSVLIHQKMFESRLFFVDRLIEMGAQIILCDPHRVSVFGLDKKNSLRGIKMSSPDIRAGVALLLAALSAQGESQIFNIEQIDRGYQSIEDRLQRLGAQIERVAS